MLKILSLFNIKTWYGSNTVRKNVPDDMGIECIKCDKVVGYTLDNQPIEDLNTVFVKNVVFGNVGISWIIK